MRINPFRVTDRVPSVSFLLGLTTPSTPNSPVPQVYLKVDRRIKLGKRRKETLSTKEETGKNKGNERYGDLGWSFRWSVIHSFIFDHGQHN